MILFNIDKKKKDSLNKIYNLVQEEKETCQEYAYILTDEFAEWFNKLFKFNTFYDIQFYEYERKEETYKNAIVLYDVLCDYISLKEENEEKKTDDLLHNIFRNIKVNDKIYNMLILNPKKYPPYEPLSGEITIKREYEDVKYYLTLSDLQNFVIEQINNRQNSALMIINEVVKHLEENGYNKEEILNTLQINYTNVANKQNEEHTERRK